MKLRIRHVFSLPFLFSLLLPVMAHATEFLQSGVPIHLSQSSASIASVYAIEVPSGSQDLTVTIRDGSGDLDLLVKRGSPIQSGPWSDVVNSADAASITDYADESIQLTAAGNPSLTAGTWYITTVNWNNYSTSFTLTATVSGSGGGAAAGSGGIPAGFTITDSSGVSVVAFNFSNAFDQSDVEDILNLVSGLMTGGAAQDAITLYTPQQLLGWGYDGTQLHQWLLDQVGNFPSYTNIVVSKQQGKIHLQATRWDRDHAGSYPLMSIDIADPLPAEQLFGLLGEGSKYLRIQTSSTAASGKRFDLYFQESLQASGVFLMGIEVSGAMLQEATATGLNAMNTTPAASTSAHPGGGGVPAGMTLGSDDELGVITFNFSSQFDMASVDSWFGMVATLLSQTGAVGSVTLYSPDQLIGWGYDATQLHNWLLGMVGNFSSYMNILVTRGQDANGGHVDLRASLWDAKHPSGIEVGTVEIGDPLPLNSLISMLNDGNRYIRITTSQPGGSSLKVALHFLVNAQAAGDYLGGLSLTEAFLQDLFSSFQQ